MIGGSALASAAFQSTGSIPDADGVFHACYDLKNGGVRLVGIEGSCRTSESATFWNQTGPKGEQGETGPKGDQGEPGVSEAYINRGGGLIGAGQEGVVASVAVPPGSYVVHGKTKVRPAPATEGIPNDTGPSGFCQVIDASNFEFAGETPEQLSAGKHLSFLEVATFTGPGTIEMTCASAAGANNGVLIEDAKIVAVKVGTIDQQAASG
jgi:hypothetical protein